MKWMMIMRISVKGRYALAAMMILARSHRPGEQMTVLAISRQLGISKIYLEQVFSLLKRGGLVSSVKGAQGGYQLAMDPQEITAYDILAAVEMPLFEKAETTVAEQAAIIELTLQSAVFEPLDQAVKTSLQNSRLSDLLAVAESNLKDQTTMYYI
jgi:Rrf2 family cysteine metabolism transcriptional repressor